MKVQMKRSGGVAGLLRPPLAVDSDALSAEEARKLHELVAAADFFNLPARGPIPPRGADRFHYTLTVEAGERTHQIQICEGEVPDSLQPLLDWLHEAEVRARSAGEKEGT
jgi:hypothetical protein